MAHLIAIQPDPSSPADIRAAGWVVAVHNDYKLAGVPHTFWLFTREEVPGDPEYAITGRGQGRFARGEGRTDADALNVVRMMVGLPLRRVIEPDPALATYCDGPHTPPDCPHCVTREGADAHPVAAARYREHRAAAKLAAMRGAAGAVVTGGAAWKVAPWLGIEHELIDSLIFDGLLVIAQRRFAHPCASRARATSRRSPHTNSLPTMRCKPHSLAASQARTTPATEHSSVSARAW